MRQRFLRLTGSLAFLLVCIAGQSGEAAAQAACGNVVMNNHSVTVSPSASITSYNAYSGMAVQSLTITVTRNNQGAANCRIGVYIEGGRTTKTLVSGANVLNYDMLRAGTPILFPNGVTPAGSNVAVFSTTPNNSYVLTVSFEVPAGQVVPASTYADLANEVVVVGVNPAGNLTTNLRRHPMGTQASVIKSCQLGTPSATTLAFAAGDIPKGLPNEGVAKSTTMNGSCTAPAFLSLTGQALQPVSSTPVRPGFDNFINYVASGTFNTGSVTLNTTVGSQTVTTASTIGATGSTVSGSVDVNVNLKRSNPIIAGSYSGTLTVTLEPAP